MNCSTNPVFPEFGLFQYSWLPVSYSEVTSIISILWDFWCDMHEFWITTLVFLQVSFPRVGYFGISYFLEDAARSLSGSRFVFDVGHRIVVLVFIDFWNCTDTRSLSAPTVFLSSRG